MNFISPQQRFYSASDFYRKRFGTKVYKIALDVGCTCPTRDGTKGTGGCTFCSESGSGDFSVPLYSTIKKSGTMQPEYPLADPQSVSEQIQRAKSIVDAKLHGRSGKKQGKYIAYFQNFTNTYGNPDRLDSCYRAAAEADNVVGIAIATRPDCINSDILQRITQLSTKTFVSLELGLQTIHEHTATAIHRGYTLNCYNDAVRRIREVAPAVHLVTHLIFGLPGETSAEMIASVQHCSGITNPLLQVDGIKISQLHILSGTAMEKSWQNKQITILEMEAYFELLAMAINNLPPSIVIHRLTGDGAKRLLLAPLWSADKKKVHNSLLQYFETHDVQQGKMI